MTRRRQQLVGVVLLAIALGLATAGLSAAQQHVGVTRPPDEASLTPLQLGAQLFAANCASCHGATGAGVDPGRLTAGKLRGAGPSLGDAGAQAADFYLRTGYMPLGSPADQPHRTRVLFDDREIRAMTAYVASLGHGPPIPTPDPARGDIADGMRQFTEHCAGCHQIAAQGGVVPGAKVPPLGDATPVQIAEAVRIGPYLMPRFSPRQISDDELNAIIRYVQLTRHPDDRGGWGIGNLGPFPEGIVAWLIAGIALVGTCMLLGSRLRE